MGEKMEMSLDDIIKSTKQSRPAFGRRGRGGPRGAGGAPRRGSNIGKTRGSAGSIRSKSRGGVNRSTPYARGDVNSQWTHDMFDGVKRMGRIGGFGGGLQQSGPSKLLVSNLDFGVSNSDVQELFAEFGPLKSASVHYDRSGRSLGTADVIFERKGDAIKAMKQYNGVPLDGRAMNIQMATSEIPSPMRAGRVGAGNFQNRTQSRVSGGGRPGGRGGARRGGGGATRGARGQPKTTPTAEELDAELDAYTNKIK